jgi:hypothetical protein
VRRDGTAPPGQTIAYVITNASWALQATPEMSECPHGLNDGVREQFKLLFPDIPGNKRTLVDTQLRRQVESYHPTAAPDTLPFLEGEGPVAPGWTWTAWRAPRTSRARTVLAASTTRWIACSGASRTIAHRMGPSASSKTRWFCARTTTGSSCS